MNEHQCATAQELIQNLDELEVFGAFRHPVQTIAQKMSTLLQEMVTQHQSAPADVKPLAAAQSKRIADSDDIDVYEIACETIESCHRERAELGLEVGTTGSLCDGIAWAFDRLKALEQDPSASRFKQACWALMNFDIHRYLLVNSEGRLDGAEKAERHSALCYKLIEAHAGICEAQCSSELFNAVHEATQALTDYMDEYIGFPLKGRPDYDVLAPKFFENFFRIGCRAIDTAIAAGHGNEQRTLRTIRISAGNPKDV